MVERWDAQREVLVRVLKDKKFTLREFAAALRFFEETTCLAARSTPSPYGPVPNDRLADDLTRWDEWFVRYGGSLTVSEGDGALEGAPECAPTKQHE